MFIHMQQLNATNHIFQPTRHIAMNKTVIYTLPCECQKVIWHSKCLILHHHNSLNLEVLEQDCHLQ